MTSGEPGDDHESETEDDSPEHSPGADPSTVEDAQVAALAALGNERRLEILLALGDRERETRVDRYALSFTELYEAVDVGSTSQFSYHPSQLVGPFVAETDDGYHLTYSGDKIVRAVRSGVYESTTSFDPVAVDGACVACGATGLEAHLEDERFVVRCRDCGRRLLSDSFPRSQAAGRTPAEIVESFGYRIWSTYLLLRGDVCPECYARTERRVDSHERGADSKLESEPRPESESNSDPNPGSESKPDPGPESDPDTETDTLYTFASICERCDFTIHLPVEVLVAFHPVAIEFLWRHGVSLLDLPLWELFALLSSDDWTTDVRATDPLEARVRIEMGDEAVAFAMDDSFTVTPREHPADPQS
jgi:DNA-binding transcriptional ArsR family regulator